MEGKGGEAWGGGWCWVRTARGEGRAGRVCGEKDGECIKGSVPVGWVCISPVISSTALNAEERDTALMKHNAEKEREHK